MLLPLAVAPVALLLVPQPWGSALLGALLFWGLAERGIWLRASRRLPVATGREAMLGQPVTALSACRPEGRVRLHGESWSARCSEGAEPGERLVVEGVELITLIVRREPAGRSGDR